MGKSPFVAGLQLELRASRLILCSHAILLWTATAVRYSKVDYIAKKCHFSGTSFYWSRNTEVTLTDFLGNCSDSRFPGLVERSLKSHWVLWRFSATKGKIPKLLVFMVKQQWIEVFSQKSNSIQLILPGTFIEALKWWPSPQGCFATIRTV